MTIIITFILCVVFLTSVFLFDNCLEEYRGKEEYIPLTDYKKIVQFLRK
jgi:hypothetical protein